MAPQRLKTPMPERRGYLLNEYTGNREYFVLRAGVLQIRQSPKGPVAGSVYLAHGSSANLLANNVIEVNTKVPYIQEYILAATSESEAEGWFDAIQASIREEQANMQRFRELMEDGCSMHKFNYSNSKRSRRYFWVADEGRQLCWGRSKGEDTQNVNLRECIGIIYGPMTTTFQRCTSLEDPPWFCFSLLFMGRTLDLTVSSDLQVHAWFLGMQHLISLHGIGSMPMMSDAQFTARKVQYKIQAVAHRNGLVFGRYLVERVRDLAAGREFKGLGSGALVSGGPLPQPSLEPSPREGKSTSSKRDRRRDAAAPDDPQAPNRLTALREKVLELKASLYANSVQVVVAEALIAKACPEPTQDVQVVMTNLAVEQVAKRCAVLAEEVNRYSEASEQVVPQVKAAEKAERSLRKLQQKFDEMEARKASLEQALSSTRASAEASSGVKKGSSALEAEARDKNDALQRRVQDLEKRLQDVQSQHHAEQDAAKNREQDEAIAAAERACLVLQQRLEEEGREAVKAREAEAQSVERLARTLELNKKLKESVRPMCQAVGSLCAEQRRARAEVLADGDGFKSHMQKLVDATDSLAAESKAMEEKYKAALDDRKRLHNQVLDLKGNIRVFVRVRPINAKEEPHEPEGEATVDFREDINVGFFDSQHARRKWFEFDQVFCPSAAQAQVFEEAKPLATSVLDGYNVCVFAYGQTGSGKTHTMTGTPHDPGLNTRVLAELFRIRDERRNDYDISFSIAITEIYNEAIRDLLCSSVKERESKKLDVKLNQDGSSGVPGLTEAKVDNVRDVLACMDDAAKNRATTTTDMNEHSSRSHSIVTVRTQCALRGEDTYIGKIHLIDLAGSENTNKSGVTGQGMKEAQNINKSLSALGDVIQSLMAKNPHTPFRNSKLTMMLKDSLGGDSKTLMIVCASPAQYNVSETLNAMNFASRARNVELGKAKRNVAS